MKQMRISKPATKSTEDSNFFSQLAFQFLPYWPLFVILLVCGVGLSILFLKFSVPVYESTASILVKAPKKDGAPEDKKMVESLNMFGSTIFVDNEIEILKSNALLGEVFKDLK